VRTPEWGVAKAVAMCAATRTKYRRGERALASLPSFASGEGTDQGIDDEQREP
jgi:hypothetical protein